MSESFSLSEIMSVALIIVCVIRAAMSYNALRKGVVDNGAQTVLNLGVLLTFIGIAYSLMHFNTNPDTMAQELDKFLAGMKTAFYTSVIGMLFGLIIKMFQSGKEEKSDKEAVENLGELKYLHKALENIEANNIKHNGEIIKAIGELKQSVETGSTEKLSDALSEMTGKMGAFIASVEASREGMKLLNENTQKQAEEFSRIISGSIETLSSKIEVAGENQTRQLAVMNDNINAMIKNSAKTAEFAEATLKDTRAFQQESLANDDKLAAILTQNTATIDGMRESFDKFLKDMAENYSNELINALNMSMEKLNTQLQSQFGDNFRQLNEAVKEVVEWQREYKDIVEKTTGELLAINETFKRFQENIVGEVDAHIEALTANLKEFTETTKQNVSVQENLNNATKELGEMIAVARENTENMRKTAENFGEFSRNTNENISRAIAEQSGAISGQMTALTDEFTGHIRKLNETAFNAVTDINHYLRDFKTVSDDVTKSIREALEAFRADFEKMTAAELKGLQAVFKQMAENTDKQQDKAIKSLAGAMGAISEQIIGDYNALIARIAELDALIKNGGSNR